MTTDKQESRQKVYELAQTEAEARMLRDAGCGYETRADALKALHGTNGMDEFYRKKLKVYELEVKS